MLKNPITIIGINPGARYLGLAVFVGPELREWRIKAFNGTWSPAKMKKIERMFTRYLDRYKPNAIAMKKLHPSRSSSRLNRLVDVVKRIAKQKRIKLREYPVCEVESSLSNGETINKKKMAELVALQNPVLLHEFKREGMHKNPYHIRMFEAVALAMKGFYEEDSEKPSKPKKKKLSLLGKNAHLP